jgi:hypothetical protein
LKDTLCGAVACEVGLILSYSGVLCCRLALVLYPETGSLVIALVLFILGLLAIALGMLGLAFGWLAWVLGAKLPFFLVPLFVGVFDRRIFDDDFKDAQTRRLWRWHLWLCPPAALLGAAAFLL